jgi:putative YhgA-like transposase
VPFLVVTGTLSHGEPEAIGHAPDLRASPRVLPPAISVCFCRAVTPRSTTRPGSWTASCEFVDLFGAAPESLRPYLPSFRHALVDLTTLDDRALSTDVRLRAFLKTLKYRRRRDLNACIAIVLAEAPMLDEEDLSVILIYLETGPTALSDDVVQETLDRLVPERILTRLLQRRFGEIPASFQQRIFAADSGAIEAWVERLSMRLTCRRCLSRIDITVNRHPRAVSDHDNATGAMARARVDRLRR